jgi:uncharacterized membrane protein YgdD (TMEM256/DUF423 family)
MNKTYISIGIVLCGLSVILGAFGAHALKSVLTPERLDSFETGVRYQLYIGIIILIFNTSRLIEYVDLNAINKLLVLGCVLFSGSIYLLALQDFIGISFKFLGPITPLGGLLIISSFVVMMIKLKKSKF